MGTRTLDGSTSRLSLLARCAALALPVLAEGGPPGIAGVGARPLTDTVAATWFIEAASPPREYRLSLVVFLVGPAGWTQKKTDWHWGNEEPAHSTFLVDGYRVHVEFSKKSGRWSVMQSKGNAKDANVVVVSGIGTGRERIIHAEKLRLTVPFDSDPILEVVRQSARLQKALGLD